MSNPFGLSIFKIIARVHHKFPYIFLIRYSNSDLPQNDLAVPYCKLFYAHPFLLNFPISVEYRMGTPKDITEPKNAESE